MKPRDHEKPREAPPWLTTMTDMNMLLMVFFISLFAMGLVDRSRRARTEEQLRRMTGSAPEGNAGESERPVELQRTTEGLAVIVGGEVAPFAEGSWELLPEHREVIAEARRWLRGRLNVILIRGHTAGNWEDSVVFEEGRVRPYASRDESQRERVADPWLLSALRADAVRAELLRPDAEPAIDEGRVRLWTSVRGDAFTASIEGSWDERRRRQNRRVEIIVTNELVRE